MAPACTRPARAFGTTPPTAAARSDGRTSPCIALWAFSGCRSKQKKWETCFFFDKLLSPLSITRETEEKKYQKQEKKFFLNTLHRRILHTYKKNPFFIYKYINIFNIVVFFFLADFFFWNNVFIIIIYFFFSQKLDYFEEFQITYINIQDIIPRPNFSLFIHVKHQVLSVFFCLL